MKKIVVFFLLMFCLVMCLSAQTSRDTVVFVYSKSDTIMLNKSNSDITVWTYVSNNGDGGFARSTTVKILLADTLCQKLNQMEISKFVLKMNSLELRFDKFKRLDSECVYWLSDRDNGVRWSSLRYKYGDY